MPLTEEESQQVRERAINLLARAQKLKTLWDYQPPPPKEEPVIKDREGSFLGMRWMEYYASKARPVGWCLLRHKWNRGLSLSYGPPPISYHKEYVDIAEGDYTGLRWDNELSQYYRMVQTPQPFWARKLPKGFMFTIAKLGGKWRVTRSHNPFIDVAIENAPLCEKIVNEDGEEDWVEKK